MPDVKHSAQISLRPYSNGDWPQVFQIVQAICEAGDTFCYPTELNEEQAKAIWLEEPPGPTIVAVDQSGRIVGTSHMSANRMGPGKHISTASFMVASGYRNQGVGRLLVEDASNWARNRRFQGMQFNAVAESNEGAIALYKSLGFRVIGTVPKGFDHPELGFVGLHIMFKSFS